MGSSAESEKEYYNAPVLQNHFQRNMHFICTVQQISLFLIVPLETLTSLARVKLPFLKGINTIRQGCIKLIKSDSKDIYNGAKGFYSK